MESLARRHFLRGGPLTAAGRRRVEDAVRPLGPKPPGVARAVAAGICNDCDAPCAAACEVSLIRFHPVGHAFAGLPYLDFRQSGCSLCGACTKACVEAGVPTEGRGADHAIAIGAARIRLERCVSGAGVLCMICRGGCPSQAIRLDLRSRPVIDPARCSGCGSCVSPCPGDAIEITEGSCDDV